MILQSILRYLSTHEVAPVGDIARAVDSTPDAVRNMMQTLERRRLVHRHRLPPGCGTGCRQCAQADAELYSLGHRPDVLRVDSPCGAGRQRF